jgi:hypothetical protein
MCPQWVAASSRAAMQVYCSRPDRRCEILQETLLINKGCSRKECSCCAEANDCVVVVLLRGAKSTTRRENNKKREQAKMR